MKHQSRKGRKFGRVKKVRKALLKSLMVALVMHNKIKTTQAKGKELIKVISPLITKAKKNDLATVRSLARVLPPVALGKMLKEIGPKYQTRPGGYLRLTKINRRLQDGAEMCYVELV
jgi:large subunit ribosomal protein L17